MSLTLAGHTFKEYLSGSQNYAGNWVPGFSPFQLFTEVRSQWNKSLFFSANMRSMGKQFVNDSNTIAVPGYILLGARCQYKLSVESSGIEIFGGVNHHTYVSCPIHY
jgi:hypothetical protein